MTDKITSFKRDDGEKRSSIRLKRACGWCKQVGMMIGTGLRAAGSKVLMHPVKSDGFHRNRERHS